MGLLDDAIREHLDLKRRRGADPAEVERLEREALGPVRRKGGEVSATLEDDSEMDALLDADDPDYDVEAAGDLAADEEPVFGGQAPPVPYAEEEEDDFEAEPDEALHDDDEHATRVMRIPDEEPAPPAVSEPAMSDATAEYDVEESLTGADDDSVEPPAGEQGEDDEDMLEETPEFLQDTPDHDRLWFEQRPPRDFDFDG